MISRSSVMQYKSGVARNLREIGQQLGVAHLLEGSVQRAANKIRVNAQLIDARTDAHLWAQTYDRDLADVFAIQSEIAKAIADQLQAKLSPNEKAAIEKPPTTDLAAFDLYTRAKTLLLSLGFIVNHQQTTQQAIELLNQAVGRDPSLFRGLLPARLCSRLRVFGGGRPYSCPACFGGSGSSSGNTVAARCRRNASGASELSLLLPARLQRRTG